MFHTDGIGGWKAFLVISVGLASDVESWVIKAALLTLLSTRKAETFSQRMQFSVHLMREYI